MKRAGLYLGPYMLVIGGLENREFLEWCFYTGVPRVVNKNSCYTNHSRGDFLRKVPPNTSEAGSMGAEMREYSKKTEERGSESGGAASDRSAHWICGTLAGAGKSARNSERGRGGSVA